MSRSSSLRLPLWLTVYVFPNVARPLLKAHTTNAASDPGFALRSLYLLTPTSVSISTRGALC